MEYPTNLERLLLKKSTHYESTEREGKGGFKLGRKQSVKVMASVLKDKLKN